MVTTVEERLTFFSTNYVAITSGIYSSGPKKFIGRNVSPRTCRFCVSKDVSFKTEAHAIPEFLGNHQLIIREECDACNKYFSETLEDHLDKLTKPFRTFAQIQGKKKIPSYKSMDKSTRIDIAEGVQIQSQIDSGHIEIDPEKNTLKIAFDYEPYIPCAAYKALVKIALSTIESPEELEAFQHALQWIRCPDHTRMLMHPLCLMVTFVPGPRPTPGVFSTLLRRKPNSEAGIPYAIYVIAFGNLVYQLVIPSHHDMPTCKSESTMQLTIPFYPTPFEIGEWEYGSVSRSTEDMSGTDRVINKTSSVSFHADSITKAAPNES